MMPLLEDLQKFSDSIALATSDAPDEYPDWSGWTYETHMADLKELWATVRPQLKRDVDRAEWVHRKLQEMFAAFAANDKVSGRRVAWELYNAEVSKLR